MVGRGPLRAALRGGRAIAVTATVGKDLAGDGGPVAVDPAGDHRPRHVRVSIRATELSSRSGSDNGAPGLLGSPTVGGVNSTGHHDRDHAPTVETGRPDARIGSTAASG